MSNPVFNNSAVFGDPKNQRGGAATQAGPAYGSPPPQGQGPAYGTPPQQGAQWGAYGAQTADAASLDAMYNAPSATTADTKRLTYDDVIMKTGGLLALLVVVGAGSWMVTPQMPALWIVGAVVGLVLGLVNSFKRNPSPALIVLYTVAQGLFLGGISRFYETAWNGVVPSAVVATVATFAAALFLFKSGRVRVTPKFMRWLLIAMVGYLVFSLVNVVLIMTGVLGGWGLYSGWGIIASLLGVGLAAASLIVDFDSIKRGVEGGVPAKFAWSAAFGLLVTLIWLYLEFLRLFAILQSSD
ncbi:MULTISPECIES: Bax inhibitor-1/YccA family protein [Cellulosimicrobium]|uniref:Bax inhibitor-1/YccA family protein n=1 Tax=Cellulosimicrobium sp. ES-005 TaxID=3163031 RepID=A0AAU8G285_9MICO|nr:Bax inhibitor-1/YccA family protein [Cellulosimicrobium cellulans]MCO7274196.1 Bax inhibitor-1/YccA family protein [Cellulosimicrobium cellulans]